MAYDLENYETVKERKQRFYSDFVDGRIIVEIQNTDVQHHALFKATLYKNAENQEKNCPIATGYAHEVRDKELSVSKKGEEYASVNYTSWVENAEESAVGRALDNAGYSGNNKCSREEMDKVNRNSPQQQHQQQHQQQNYPTYKPCPNCGKQLRKDKNKEQLYCWYKKGERDGCGKNFTMAYDEIVKKDEQPSFDDAMPIPNEPDISF